MTTGKSKNKIAICEPSDIIYEGLISILNKSDYHCSIFRMKELNELIHTNNCSGSIDILFVNPSYPQLSNRYLTKIIRKFPNIKIIAIISSLINSSLLEGFSEQFNILDSEQHILNIISNLLNHSTSDDNDNSDERLTDRETEVLIQMVHGLSNKEIAEKLNISIHTVISHRKNITCKTGVKSQSGLTIYAISKHIVSMDDF